MLEMQRGPGEAGAESLARAALILVALREVGAAREAGALAAAAAQDGSPAQRIAALALEGAGEPSKALELAHRSGQRAQERRLTGRLRELDPDWTPELPAAEIRNTEAPHRALCLLEASLPHAPSGYAYRSRDLLRALREAGFDPVAATRLGFPASRGVREYAPIEEVDGIVHHRFNVPGLRQYSGVPIDIQLERNAECLLELVKEIEPDVIVAGTPVRNGILGRALRSATGIPFVYDVRGFPEMTWAAQPGGAESELYDLRRHAETACVVEADVAITLSQTMRTELVGRGADSDSVYTVPHVVDTERFSPRPRDVELARSYGVEGRFVVGSVTSLTDYEGLEEFLRALAWSREERPDLAALIVGDGPARVSLESLADELGIGDAVVFTGRIDQARIVDHYSLLDLFALPRRDLEVCRSVTPLKPFEALAMGIPILASDLPALAELVSNSGGGRLVPAESQDDLAEAILTLANEPSERRRLGSNAREYAVANHSQARAAEALRAALDPLLG
jgi:glycosyltransferase involved in cell wall biosynthesis